MYHFGQCTIPGHVFLPCSLVPPFIILSCLPLLQFVFHFLASVLLVFLYRSQSPVLMLKNGSYYNFFLLSALVSSFFSFFIVTVWCFLFFPSFLPYIIVILHTQGQLNNCVSYYHSSTILFFSVPCLPPFFFMRRVPVPYNPFHPQPPLPLLPLVQTKIGLKTVFSIYVVGFAFL